MKKAVWSSLVTAAAVLMFAAPAAAQQTDTGAINVTVQVNARAILTLGTAAVTFADADPDVTPTFTSGAIDIEVRARTGAGNVSTLTMQADGDLVSGTDSIGINNLTWTVTGTGYQAGTANATTAQTVGSWTGPTSADGTHTFSLPNSWTYPVGTYTAVLNYTLSVP